MCGISEDKMCIIDVWRRVHICRANFYGGNFAGVCSGNELCTTVHVQWIVYYGHLWTD